jgi:hypothetical protein
MTEFYCNWIPTCFNVIGCEYSTDIDIIIPVPFEQIIFEYKKFPKNKNFPIDLSFIKLDLIRLGYDLELRNLDINLVYIDSKTSNITNCLIGETKLTQNIIFNTYLLHPQAYSQIISNPVQIDLSNYVRLFSKIVLDWMEKILGKFRYKELRPKKKQTYNNLTSRLDFSLEILQETNFVDLFNTNKNIVKSIGMKLCQIILLYFDNLEFTKKNISNQISNFLPVCNDVILYVLSRGVLGKINVLEEIQQIFSILINQYEIIIQEIKQNVDLVLVPINLDSYTSNPINLVIDEFIKSPEKPTLELSNYIGQQFIIAGSINKIFELESLGCDLLSDSIKNHIHIENQRSIEWLDLLKFYKCGNTINNTIPFVDCETNFNLIRGCLGEKLLIDLVNWDDLIGEPVSKCICGLLVENKGLKDSRGIAPDLLLISNNNSNQIFPVEIKTLVSDPNIINRKFLREIQLGSKQLDTSIGLINKITGTNTYGLIVFCFIHNNKITIKYKKYF